MIFESNFIVRLYIFVVFYCYCRIIERIIMEIAERIFQIGQFVYAKMKFYPPWPAFILELRRSTARVQFLGWNNQWYDERLDTYHFVIIFCEYIEIFL